MKFYHGTNEYGFENTKKQGFLLHERKIEGYNPEPCVYLATDPEEAKNYGDIVLEVEYDPYKNPKKNNYQEGCWQVRVYEPIYKYKIWKKENVNVE